MIDGQSLLTSLAGETWAIVPAALSAFVDRTRAADASAIGRLPSAQSALEGGNAAPYAVVDGVAHIPIQGTILKRVPWWARYFGLSATGTEDLIYAVRCALDDDAVHALLFRVDSPGGTISGVQEAADVIYAARSVKPSRAHGDGMIASAAYWLASSAGKISASTSTPIGSIGVYRVLDDYSEMFAKRGIKTHVISSHPLKGIGVGGASITDEQRAAEQRVIDSAFEMFTGSVARGRGQSLAASATGEVWFAADALGRGLIDDVSTDVDAHVALAAAKPPTRSRPFVLEASPAPAAAADQLAPIEVGAPAAPLDGASEVTMTTGTNPAPAAVDYAAEAEKYKREAEAARADAAKAKAEAAVHAAAAAESRKARAIEAIDRNANRVTPAMRPQVDKYAEAVGYCVATIEAFIATLPIQTKPSAAGHEPSQQGVEQHDPEVPSAVAAGRWTSTPAEDALVAKKLRIPVADMQRYSGVKGVNPASQTAIMRDGSTVALGELKRGASPVTATLSGGKVVS